MDNTKSDRKERTKAAGGGCEARHRSAGRRKDHVYAASIKTKVEGMLENVVPGSVKGAMHEKMAKPKTAGS